MTRIIGLSGSLRRQSFNTGLLRAAAELAPEGVTIAVHTPEGIPRKIEFSLTLKRVDDDMISMIKQKNDKAAA